ncbi:proline dehydrogenase family protein [Halostagnicola sp. A-GB9-2]|uniref:proline dehydrogenase family protein n=1 Tax=Halostagnicola sp. A-GB9-2 TaxID=3048066 RepID=UPI0024BFA0B1|nr:proline dehydrogenase family protein [Halostagnicola sp. A-GB9-2]MDJ1432385.1 proline dehydrogenase family protein [Halostagnicola sp. A-GB9-2]
MIPPIASRFVAGESPPEALEHVQQLNDDGVGAILNLLGEHHDDPDVVADDTDAYCSLVESIAMSGFDVCISVKPSQIGLDIGPEAFESNLERIVSHAAERDVFVWVDMENHTTTDATLEAYERLAREYASVETAESMESAELEVVETVEGGTGSEGVALEDDVALENRAAVEGAVGLCLQANLKRTREDLERLNDVPGKVRLVKGAYDEPKSIAYKDKDRVDKAYRTLLEDAFQNRDGGIAVGSHDPAMIAYARELHEEYGTPYEVQMLMGVREDAQRELAAEGVTVYQYVPYGSRWLLYFYRRVRERKENLLFAARAILS